MTRPLRLAMKAAEEIVTLLALLAIIGAGGALVAVLAGPVVQS